MSIENAILELAAAINKLAESNSRDDYALTVQGEVCATLAEAAASAKEPTAKPSTAKEAVKQALEAAQADKSPAAAPVEEADPLDDEAAVEALDWDKDVKPVLGKITDKAKLVALLGEFGAKNGGELKAMADKFPAVLVAAKKVLGE